MYLTVIELNELVSTLYTSVELEKLGWSNISDTDKCVYIKKAENDLNNYKYRGYQRDLKSNYKFPRVIDGVDVGIPYALKIACVLKAINYISIGISNRLQLQQEGVKAISTSDVSESYELKDRVEYLVTNYISNYLL